MQFDLKHYDDTFNVVFTEYFNLLQVSTVGLFEYGRGDKELAEFLIDNGYDVKIYDDYSQNIFRPTEGRYKGLDDHFTEYNILGNPEPPDVLHDVIFCSLPNMIPGVPNDAIYPKLRSAFERMYGMLNPGGYIITCDYNSQNIKRCVDELFDSVRTMIDVDEENKYFAVIRYSAYD